MSWYVYILECADSTYYTGITTDIDRRVAEHNEGPKGAKYTKARRPVQLIYTESVVDKSAASKREYAIRTLTRSQKKSLAQKS